jgi:hypothetical protein
MSPKKIIMDIAAEAAKEAGSTGMVTIVNSTSKGLTQCGYLTNNIPMKGVTIASTAKGFSRAAKVVLRVGAGNGKVDMVSGANIASMTLSGVSSGLRMSSMLLQNGTISYATAGVAQTCHIAAIGLSAFADGLEGGSKTVSQQLYDLLLG